MEKCAIDDVLERINDTKAWLDDAREVIRAVDDLLNKAYRELDGLYLKIPEHLEDDLLRGIKLLEQAKNKVEDL